MTIRGKVLVQCEVVGLRGLRKAVVIFIPLHTFPFFPGLELHVFPRVEPGSCGNECAASKAGRLPLQCCISIEISRKPLLLCMCQPSDVERFTRRVNVSEWSLGHLCGSTPSHILDIDSSGAWAKLDIGLSTYPWKFLAAHLL
jgi:hypothetical protein